MAIILSIKVSEMQKKIKSIVAGERDNTLFSLLQDSGKSQLNYQEFKELIVAIVGSMKERLRVSEDDIKTLFFVLDPQKNGVLGLEELEALRGGTEGQLREFYRSRINK